MYSPAVAVVVTVPGVTVEVFVFVKGLTLTVGVVGLVSSTVIVRVIVSAFAVLAPLTLNTGFFWSIMRPVDTGLILTL